MSDTARPPWVSALVVALAFAALVGLGLWQLDRKAWKQALIDTMNERVAAAPADPPGQELWPSLNADNTEFRRVRLDADFIDVPDTYVYVAGSALRDDIKSPGYFVFRPARLANGTTVVVNRGYVPLDYTVQSPAGHQRVVGYLRWPEAPSAFVSSSSQDGNTWFVRDQRAMAEKKGWGEVAPFYIDQESPVPASGFPRPASLQVRFRNDHLQYALTWFSLAGVLLVISVIWTIGRRRRPASVDVPNG